MSIAAYSQNDYYYVSASADMGSCPILGCSRDDPEKCYQDALCENKRLVEELTNGADSEQRLKDIQNEYNVVFLNAVNLSAGVLGILYWTWRKG